jgi:hypothetical protein
VRNVTGSPAIGEQPETQEISITIPTAGHSSPEAALGSLGAQTSSAPAFNLLYALPSQPDSWETSSPLTLNASAVDMRSALISMGNISDADCVREDIVNDFFVTRTWTVTFHFQDVRNIHENDNGCLAVL